MRQGAAAAAQDSKRAELLTCSALGLENSPEAAASWHRLLADRQHLRVGSLRQQQGCVRIADTSPPIAGKQSPQKVQLVLAKETSYS